MIDTTAEHARFTGKIFCYVAVHSPIPRDDQFAIGIAVLGEPGYSFPLALELFATYNKASSRAEALNTAFPYSAETCVAIVADTMIRQSQRRANHRTSFRPSSRSDGRWNARPPGRQHRPFRNDRRFLRCRRSIEMTSPPKAPTENHDDDMRTLPALRFTHFYLQSLAAAFYQTGACERQRQAGSS